MKFLSDLQLGSALLVSSVLHFVIIIGIPGLGMLTFNKPISQIDEMTYIAISQAPHPQPARLQSGEVAQFKSGAPAQAMKVKDAVSTKKAETLKARGIAKTAPKRMVHSQSSLRSLKKIEPKLLAIAFTDKPLINKLSEADIMVLRNSPLYRDYCQIIREAVRQQATTYYNRFTEIGEVTLSFVLQSDGTLKEVRIVEDASTENEYLRTIASQSVLNAGPYPAFPKGFPIRELIFKLPISFRGGRIDLS